MRHPHTNVTILQTLYVVCLLDGNEEEQAGQTDRHN